MGTLTYSTELNIEDFLADAAKLIDQWASMDQSERDETPSFATLGYGPLPFTVEDDLTVIIGNYTDGMVGGSSDADVFALATTLRDTAEQVDYTA